MRRIGSYRQGDAVSATNYEIVDCVQGTEEWFAAKMGIPSSSHFKDVLAGGDGIMRKRYMAKLMGEKVFGIRSEEFRNADMLRGIAMEPYLRNSYAMEEKSEVKQIGFIKRKLRVGWAGCSPDALVGNSGLLEIKTAGPEILHDIMKTERIPSEHITQCQGALWITNRMWLDIVIGLEPQPGYQGTKHFRRRMKRDESLIKRIELGVEVFNEQLEEMCNWMRKWSR